LKYDLVIAGVIKKNAGRSRYGIVLNGKASWLSWKSFTYLCILARHAKIVRISWVHEDILEPQNVARCIYALRKEIGVPDLIENDKHGGYRINPKYTFKVTEAALELIERG